MKLPLAEATKKQYERMIQAVREGELADLGYPARPAAATPELEVVA